MPCYDNVDREQHTKVCSAGSGGSGIKGANIGEPDMKSAGLDPDPCIVSATAGEADMATKDKSSWAVTLPAERHVGRFGLGIIVADLEAKV